MVVFQLLSAVLVLSLDQLFRSRYGALGALCLLLLGVGLRARSTACLSAGAIVFLVLMAQA
ncbi:hypothetical protein [Streptomyces sp. Root369]|uniref:hypothetical protein n=1 Tax=Streptomyces sp. Root369 TaxID=1736523 RepID=UPI00070B3AA6|nr:hypothetical protein [Streptomyces sp. Root369]KQW16935.1 hypothetical protein ASD08_23705 [Streptomyces sp. Root369]